MKTMNVNIDIDGEKMSNAFNTTDYATVPTDRSEIITIEKDGYKLDITVMKLFHFNTIRIETIKIYENNEINGSGHTATIVKNITLILDDRGAFMVDGSNSRNIELSFNENIDPGSVTLQINDNKWIRYGPYDSVYNQQIMKLAKKGGKKRKTRRNGKNKKSIKSKSKINKSRNNKSKKRRRKSISRY